MRSDAECYHFNASYKKGTCILNGNQDCPYRDSDKAECPIFLDHGTEVERRRGLRGRAKYL